MNELTARSLSFARALAPTDVHAVTIKGDDKRLHRLEESWADHGHRRSPDRDRVPVSGIGEAGASSTCALSSLGPDHVVTVIIPEFVVEHWWEAALHNQNAFRLKGALLLVPWVVVLSVPFHIGSGGMNAPAQPEGEPARG